MSAYVIVDVAVHDPDAYERYKGMSLAAVTAFGGRFIVRGGKAEVLEGEWTPQRVVVVEFDTVEQAKSWWSSDEYAPAKALRQSASTGKIILVEGPS